MQQDAQPIRPVNAGSSPFLIDTPSQGGIEEGIDFRTYLRILRQQKWRILGFGLLFALLGLLIALRSTPVYRADVKLLAEPVESKVSNNNQWVSTALVWLYYETQKEIILSRNIALQVVDKLDLVARAKQEAAEAAQDHQKFFDLDWRLWLPEQWRPKEVKLTDEEQRLAIADDIIANLTVTIGKDSQIIVVSYDDTDPTLAAEIANAVAVAYRDFGLSSRMNTAQQQTQFLNEQLQVMRAKVTKAEQALQDYQQSEGLIDTESRHKIVTAELAGLSEQLISAQAKRSEAEIRYREVQRLQGENGSYDSLVAVLQSNLVAKLREKQSDLARKVSELSERYGEKHPKMVAARSELAEAERALKQAISKVVGSLQQEYQVALQQESKIRNLIAQRESSMQNLRGKGFQLSKLEREAENARQVYEQFLSKLNELDVTGEYDVSNVRVVDEASVPNLPVKPNKPRIVLGAAFLGLLLGVFLAFVRDRMDASFKLLEHAESKLGVTGLGIVPLMARRDLPTIAERVAAATPHSPFAESINHIRTGVLFSNIDHPPQVVMVTSSVAGEGKTTLASNLAFALSQLGRTLLIECDLRRPRLADIYGLPPDSGITDLVLHPDRVSECVSKAPDGDDFYLLPAGNELPNPLEFLSSEAFARLLEALRKKFTHIVLDAPPVLPVSDGIVLTRRVDAMVLVVRADQTTDRMARESLKRIRAAHIEPIGVVLTQASAKKMAQYGDHYYGDKGYYGYGYGERDRKGQRATGS